MVNSKTLKISIGTIIKKFSDYLKNKKVLKNAVKKLPFVIKYVPDQYKTKDIIVENGGMLGFILDCYKDQNL